MEERTRQQIVGRLLRLGVSGRARSSSDDQTAVGELEMELALLREENARLKVERHRPPDAGRIIERMRDLGQASVEPLDEVGSQTSEGAQVIVECMAIRDGLVAACLEIQQAMRGMRARLSVLSVDLQGRTGDRATSNPIVGPSTAEVELELAVGARAASDLSQSAA
jgi:hypothetical protein